MNIPQTLLPTLNVIAMQKRVNIEDVTLRKLTNVVEVIDLDPVSKEILTNEVFRWDPLKDNFEYSGRSTVLDKIMESQGIKEKEMKEELDRRKLVLDWMGKNKIRRYDEVGAVIREYYSNPEKLANKAKLGLSV
jgi:flagellar protein FlaI